MRISPILLLLVLLLTATSAASQIMHPVILEFLPNPAAPMDQGEYVIIRNPTDHTIDLSGFILTDLEREFGMSNQTILESGSDYRIELPAHGIHLSNSGDEVILLDSDRNMVDCAIYGDSGYSGDGWNGTDIGRGAEERIFRRFYLDNDTDTAYEWLPLREYYRGQSNFVPPLRRFSGKVTAFVSPDCSLRTLQEEIRNASVLRVNIYLFESHDIEQEILDMLNRGGEVHILIEERPVGGISDSGVGILRRIMEKGGSVRFSDDPLYRLNHAKYALIDGDTTILGSENWNSGGYPPDGFSGNRGWGIIIRDRDIFSDLSSVFEHDWERGTEIGMDDLPQESGRNSQDESEDRIRYRIFDAKDINGDFTASVIIAPDNSLHYETLVGMINSAEKTIYIEQAYIKRDWEGYENPYLQAAKSAAMRGVEVKILIDSMWYNTNKEDDNDELCRDLNYLASQENLNLEARLVKRDGISKIHNKGVIVDERKVLISSINWNKHSPTYNREAGIIIENPDLAAYYTDAFLYDWGMERGSSTSTTVVLLIATVVVLLASAIYLASRRRGT
ncbi:MAG: phospholipase D-like domain-containing protein [Euryarchaeota archaeon]|nr:phospholipase D-like domain-containing protein [Euryarchaeota archaeon]